MGGDLVTESLFFVAGAVFGGGSIVFALLVAMEFPYEPTGKQ
jgi:hypothetical protein